MASAMQRRADPVWEPQELHARAAQLAARHAARAIEIRHQIHRQPELGNREFRTAEHVARELRRHDIPTHEGVAHTGVVGTIVGALPGPTIAIRADMDALPIEERSGLAFRSRETAVWQGRRVPVSHACGHDVHTAVQLGVAATLAALRPALPGSVKLIFQPAEEGPPEGEEGGARLMIAEGALEDPSPEAIFALHIAPELPVGSAAFTIGPAWAAVDELSIRLHGRPAHGARPELSVDPVVMAAELVMSLQTIAARNLSPLEPAVVTVGAIRGGERFNVIPELVQLEGTVRTYSPDARDLIERRIKEIVEGVARAHGGSSELRYRRVTPPVINNAELAGRLLPTLSECVGAERLLDHAPSMGGEDFAFFAQRVPGFYFRLGSTASGTESGGLHTPTLRADDETVRVGMRTMAALVTRYLSPGV